MNILVIAHYQDDGSPYVSFVHDQAKEYVKAGHKVWVIAPMVLGKKYKEEFLGTQIVDGITVYYPRVLSFSNAGRYNLNTTCAYFVIKKIIAKLIQQEKIDVIHAHTIVFDGAVAIKAKAFFNIPVIITTHGTDTFFEIRKGFGEKIRNICKSADKTIAVSSKLAKVLSDGSLQPEVILNGFNHYKIPEKVKEPYSIIQVGSLISRKKTDLTIRAFQQILRKYPEAKLTIVGEGREESALKNLCVDLQLEGKVAFKGAVSNQEILELMAMHQVFIMPSIYEGLGIVYLEAMYSKCITIGTEGEGISDIIESGANGFLINRDSVESIIKTIINIFSDSNEKRNREIINNAIETVESLTWKNNAKQYLHIFEEIKRMEK